MKKKVRDKIEANRQQVNAMLQQQLTQEPHRNFSRYFEENGIHTVAVYGAGAVGRELVRQLKNTVGVEYLIDKFACEDSVEGVPVLSQVLHFLPEVDAVIITPCHELDFIVYEIRNFYTDDCRLIGLNELLERTGAGNEA